MREEPGFLHKCVQYEISLRTENVLRMKMGNFKKSCLKIIYKILKFANFENGGTAIQRDICMLCENSCQLHCCWSIKGLSISRCKYM